MREVSLIIEARHCCRRRVDAREAAMPSSDRAQADRRCAAASSDMKCRPSYECIII